MKNEHLRKILIEGIQVQGVNLREEIKERADKEKITNAFIKNRRDMNCVFIICQKEDVDKLKKIINDIRREKGDLIKMNEPIDTEELTFPYDFSEKEFRVDREDDLHEMMWALQGSGRIFSVIEKRRIRSMISGLAYELGDIGEWLTGEIKNGHDTTCINNFLTYCPIDEASIIEKLQDIRRKCAEINAIVSGNLPENEKSVKINSIKSELLGKDKKIDILTLIDMVKGELEAKLNTS